MIQSFDSKLSKGQFICRQKKDESFASDKGDKQRSSGIRSKHDDSSADQRTSDEQQQEISKFKRNLRRFEEERRRFEVEREKFEREKRDLVEKQRCRRLEEFERKRMLRQFQEAKEHEMHHHLSDNHHRPHHHNVHNQSSGHETMESDDIDSIFRPTVIRRKSQCSMLDRYKLDEEQQSTPVQCLTPLGVTPSVTPAAHEKVKPPEQSLLHRLIFGKRSAMRAKAKSTIALEQWKPLPDDQMPSLRYLMIEAVMIWRKLLHDHPAECRATRNLRNRCIIDFIILCLYLGAGGLLFRFVEGAFENFYKCGVRRVKRDFVDHLWHSSHNLRFDD